MKVTEDNIVQVVQKLINQQCCGLHTTTIDLSAAELKTSNSVPVVLLDAPGEGKSIFPVAAAYYYTHGSQAFTFSYGAIRYISATGVILEGNLVFSQFSDTSNPFTISTSIVGNEIDLIENEDLVFTTDSNSATGNGTMKIFLIYKIIDL